jgi:excisionase family DNA binding protein
MVSTQDESMKKYFEEPIMTSREVAEYLKISAGAVRRWTRDGILKGHKLGGRGDWRYQKSSVVSFLLGSFN